MVKDFVYISSGVEGSVTLFGVNIFDYKWIDTKCCAEVKDPLYGQKHTFNIYKINCKRQGL